MTPYEIKTSKDREVLIAITLLNTLLLYVFAFKDLLNGDIGLSSVASSFVTGLWLAAFWTDGTIFDFKYFHSHVNNE